MFELLLQADKALSEGSLDQAERTYWQLIDLDPTNAIAVAGLARVSLQRGDEQSARAFADQALSIDPDSIAARKVLDILAHTAADPAWTEPSELPLRAAQHLEALSKRRTTSDTDGDAGAGAPRGGSSKNPGSRSAPPATKPTAGTGAGKAASASKEGRGRTRPDEIVPLPSEPLRERRQAGRLAAAAAAAAAAVREPVKARRQVHHAMPVGRRFFGPEGLKGPLADAFSEAEMAAAVAAVDGLDDPGVAIAREPTLAGQADVMGAVDATAADESVALRLALVMDAVDLEAAEREAANSIGPDEVGDSDFAGAESDAATEAVTEVAASDDDDFDIEPPPIRRTIVAAIAEEPSEEEAEAQALREAIALVLQGESEGRSVDATAEEDGAPVKAQNQAEARARAKAEAGVASTEAGAESSSAATNPEGTAETETVPGSPSQKRGLFHRIRGS